VETTFSTEQYDHAYPDGGEWHWWPLARNRIVRDFVAEANGHRGNAGAPILEVGCGRGIVVKSLRDAGYDCRGVEAATLEPIAGAGEFVTIGVGAEQLPLEERERYATVLLLDVVEHVPDALSFLREIVEAFPNLARVVVTVPARQELWSNYDEYYGHFRRYSKRMLVELASELGWETRRIGYFFHCLYLPAWLVANVKGRRSTEVKAPGSMGRAVHKLVALGMLADHYLLPGSLIGTSLIASFKIHSPSR
jgi:SAM-dependent methyltransferase